jgi:hypothetical protein
VKLSLGREFLIFQLVGIDTFADGVSEEPVVLAIVEGLFECVQIGDHALAGKVKIRADTRSEPQGPV